MGKSLLILVNVCLQAFICLALNWGMLRFMVFQHFILHFVVERTISLLHPSCSYLVLRRYPVSLVFQVVLGGLYQGLLSLPLALSFLKTKINKYA